MFSWLFWVEDVRSAPSPLGWVEDLVERADVVGYDEGRSGAAHTQLFPHAFVSSPSDRLSPGVASHVERDLRLCIHRYGTKELVRVIAHVRLRGIFHVVRDSGELVGTPMLLNHAECTRAH